MKTRFPFFCFGLASLSATAILVTRIAGSAAPPPDKSKPEKVLARTRSFDAVSATNPIPVSVFIPPTNKVAGRDPFFPDCDCGVKMVVKIDTGKPEGPSLALVYQGRSGTPEKPLAIINGNTFEQGESHDVSTGSSRISIRLVEFKENSVIVEIGGKQTQELFLRGNK
jgi:hypothetical protein